MTRPAATGWLPALAIFGAAAISIGALVLWQGRPAAEPGTDTAGEVEAPAAGAPPLLPAAAPISADDGDGGAGAPQAGWDAEVARRLAAAAASAPGPEDDGTAADALLAGSIEPSAASGADQVELRLQALATEARQAADAGDRDRARRLLAEALELREEPALRLGLAAMQFAGGDLNAADLSLDRIPRDRREANWYTLTGRIAYQRERLDAAYDAFEQAYQLGAGDPALAMLDRIQRERATTGDLRSRQSAHFRLSIEGGAEPVIVHALLAAAEDSYRTLNQQFRITLESPIPVILYAHESFQRVTQAPHWAGGLFDGKVRIPVGDVTRISTEFRSVLTHEITHAVVYKKAGPGTPRWLQEGLAQHYEGKRFEQLWPSVQQQGVAALIVANDLSDPDLFYASSLGRVQFMMERYGHLRVMQLLDGMRAGRDVDAARSDAMGVDRHRFEADFQLWLEKQSRQGG